MIKLSKDTLNNSGVHFTHQDLSTVQRILLSSDGTMTNLLEELLREELWAHKLVEKISACESDIPQLELTQGQMLWHRIITLQGKHSGIHFLHAESLIAPDNLDEGFSDKLLNSNIPIGKIWELFKVETYKNLTSWGVEPAGEIAKYFQISTDQLVLYRTYRVFSQKKPVMQVTEKFPLDWFRDNVLTPNMVVRQA